MVVTDETDPEVLRAELPEPLAPIEQPLVHYEWMPKDRRRIAGPEASRQPMKAR